MVRLSRLFRSSCVAAAACASALALPSAASAGPVTPVDHVDLAQYVGQWRQIASIPQWFESLCASDTVANYGAVDPVTIRVVNRCFAPGGVEITTRGRATVLDTATNAQLQVTFAYVAGRWLTFGSDPNYVIIGLDPSYRWAVVGDPQRTSAFVLARDPKLTASERQAAADALTRNGFDPCSLRTTRQRGGLQVVQPFCR